MTRTRWIIFVIICVLGLASLVVFTKKDSANVDNLDAAKIISGENGDHVFGKPDAKVVLFEYGDFACPGCEGAFPKIKALKQKNKDQIAFVFRNMPLTSIHPNALAAATAAEAAGLQGKFWEMHDKLYENQDSWSTASSSARTDFFVQYASQIGLDTDRFTRDLSSKTVSEKIARDRSLANKLKVDSTPTFYINDEKMDKDTVQDVVQSNGQKLNQKIDEHLKAAGVSLPQ